MTENLNKWMDDVTIGSASLPNNKGIVAAIHEPKPITTKYGERKKCQVVINGSDGSIVNVGLFLPEQFPMVHPKSNLGKILAHNGCTGLKDLIGKEVEVSEVGDGMWGFKTE